MWAGLGAWASLAGLTGCSARPRPIARAARVVSLSVVADEILWALGPAARARVVGVTHLVDDPEISGVAGRWSPSLARVEGTAESVATCRPDLVIVSHYTQPETIAALEAAGVECLDLGPSTGLAQFVAQLERLGARLGCQPEAGALLQRLDRRVDALAARRPSPPAPRVVHVEDGWAAGRQTTFDDACRLAGLRNPIAHDGHRPLPAELRAVLELEWVIVGCPRACGDRVERARRDWAALRPAGAPLPEVVAVEPVLLSSGTWGIVDLAAALQAEILGLPRLPPLRAEVFA